MKPSDGDRLSDVDPEFARLVSALRKGAPSEDALARTLGAVNAVAAEAPAPRSGSRPVKATTVALGAGALALVLAATGYEWSRDATPRPAPAAPTVAAPAHEPFVPSEVPTASVRVEDLPPAAPPPEPPAPSTPQARASSAQKPAPSIALARPSSTDAPAVDDFRDELALVERVRTQLSRGDNDACLRSIDQYGRRFSGGAFVQEVAVMRIEALAASGDRERARAFAANFLSEHPTSPYAGRVRSVLENNK